MNKIKRKLNKREKVFKKYNGKCAYCGFDIDFKTFNVDHIVPKVKGGNNSEMNLNPSCFQCNTMKKDLTIEEFRINLQNIVTRLSEFGLVTAGIRYGLIKLLGTDTEVVFYYEKCGHKYPDYKQMDEKDKGKYMYESYYKSYLFAKQELSEEERTERLRKIKEKLALSHEDWKEERVGKLAETTLGIAT